MIAASWFAGASAGGLAPSVVGNAARVVGLETQGIVITGQVQTSENDVIAALALPDGGSLVGFDLAEARERLLNLPWVRDVSIRKVYPGSLEVGLAERRAAAVWQLDDKLTVVERSGRTIAAFGIADLLDNRFAHLPHLVGIGAAERADEILPLLAQFPALAGRIEAIMRVGGRRWDLLLAAAPGETLQVMLPQHGLGQALERLARFDTETRVLERQVSALDLRLPDRMTVRMSADAAAAHDKQAEDDAKAMRRILRDAAERPV
ncbi:FtsQ-type POTRA domain-containing protein [Rhizobiaceae bacterium]|nr:FtsQ-type POTRA domain-containing protein [Rhizobiaceae bacterium]